MSEESYIQGFFISKVFLAWIICKCDSLWYNKERIYYLFH